jgi:ABC-type uncharacterized transport system substrate-binding protein
MRRIGLAVVFVVSLLAAPLGTEAQQASHIPHIGVLESSSCASAFRQGLIDLGYVEGHTIAFEYRPGGSFAQQIEQAQDLTRRKVDLLVATNSRAALAAKQVTRAIPIVAAVSDAVGWGSPPPSRGQAGTLPGSARRWTS